MAASFVTDTGWRSGKLDLLFAGENTVHLGQGSEGEGVGRMLEALACVERVSGRGFGELADAVVTRLGGFGACVLVLLDWDEPRRSLGRSVLASRATALVLEFLDLRLKDRESEWSLLASKSQAWLSGVLQEETVQAVRGDASATRRASSGPARSSPSI